VRTVLVIASTGALAGAVRAALEPERYRVIEHSDFREDELRLTAASIDACIIDADLTSVEPIRTIEQLRRVLPHCPTLLYTSDTHWSWEEDAYLLGVKQILSKPVRARLLNSLLDRIFASGNQIEPRSEGVRARLESKPAAEPIRVPSKMVELLRNYTSILAHTLSAESMLKEFLLLLREMTGINRAAIFLRQPAGGSGDPKLASASQRLYSACAIGLAPGLLEHFHLSLDHGLGAYIFRSGRLLRRDSEEVERDSQMRREFDLLSAQVAIPVLDRESLVGVAVVDFPFARTVGDGGQECLVAREGFDPLRNVV
jgi:DNA-binding NarL/FixJ family response regulator